LFSPAKINLGLEVHHRRPEDGYHYLSSIFIPISFGDKIEFELSNENSLTSINHLPDASYHDFEAVTERGDFSKNLLYKVLKTLEKYIQKGVSIHLEKKIPSGAGLGGGSSNAAQLLKFLQKQFNIEENIIFETARKLGADIPFFLQDSPMLVTGIGDRFQKISLGSAWGVLTIPDIQVSTPNAYRALKRTLHPDHPPKNLSGLSETVLEALKHSRWEMAGNLVNDFEKVVFNQYPEFRGVKDLMLENGAQYSSLSGSGSAIYCLFKENNLQKTILEKLNSQFPRYSSNLFRILNKPED